MIGSACKILLLALATAAVGMPAAARPLAARATIACENGRAYVFAPVAVSDTGDVVTAQLQSASRRTVKVRLIPMGSGYRYAGRGIWLDGIRNQAVLNLGTSASVSCEITPAIPW